MVNIRPPPPPSPILSRGALPGVQRPHRPASVMGAAQPPGLAAGPGAAASRTMRRRLVRVGRRGRLHLLLHSSEAGPAGWCVARQAPPHVQGGGLPMRCAVVERPALVPPQRSTPWAMPCPHEGGAQRVLLPSSSSWATAAPLPAPPPPHPSLPPPLPPPLHPPLPPPWRRPLHIVKRTQQGGSVGAPPSPPLAGCSLARVRACHCGEGQPLRRGLAQACVPRPQTLIPARA
jgi:hypothetical protein